MKTAKGQIENLVDQYDDQLSQLIQQKMHELNNEIHEKRINGHPNIQAILDEAHAIEARANRASEIQITERHLGNPVFFYSKGSLLWKMNEAINFGATELNFIRLSAQYDNGDYQLHVLISNSKQPNYRLFSFGKNDFLESGRYWGMNFPVFIYDINIFGNERYVLTEDGVSKLSYPWDAAQNQSYKAKNAIQKTNNVIPRLAIDIKNDRAFYLHHDKNRAWIQKVNLKKPMEAHESLIDTTKELKKAVDLCFDPLSQRLLIQDFDTKKIVSVETLEEREYPYFASHKEYIEIPSATWRSGKDFTLSFWAKSDVLESTNDFGDELDDTIFHISYGLDDSFHLAYHQNGQLQTSKPKMLMPEIVKMARDLKEWYHFVVVKSGTKITCYLNSYRVLVETMPAEIDTYFRNPALKFRFSFAGHYVTELRLWDTARKVQEIDGDATSWLHSGTPNLSGNWRLDSTEILDTNKLDNLQHTKLGDYSGNGRHAATFSGKWRRTHVPEWSKIIPIYSFNTLSQNLTIDTNVNRIYWIDQEPNTGWYYVMGGHTLGHISAIQVHTTSTHLPDPGMTVLGAENKPFERLIMAHAKRRNAFRTILEKASHSVEKAHDDVTDAHEEILTNNLLHADSDDHPHSKNAASEMNSAWGMRIEQMHQTEKEQQREIARRRLLALEKVRLKSNEIHQQMAAIRREIGITQLRNRDEND